MTETLADLVRRAANRLRERTSPFNTPDLDAELLARHLLGWDRARWIADKRDAAPPGFGAGLDGLIFRRLRGEPVAYIVGMKEFWGLDFEVSRDVLIPRPETELLVERALQEIDRRDARQVADIGTGSGCIAVSLARERPSLRVIATDISERALEVARRNAARHGVADRITFEHMASMPPMTDLQVVVSNPPYIASRDALSLMSDVVDFEPHLALFAGGDGLDVIRAILAAVAACSPPPALIFEFGGNQEAIGGVVRESGLRLREVLPDLAGIPRVAVVEG